MKSVQNLTATSRALVAFQLDVERRKPKPNQVRAFYFMPSFTNADGTLVKGFVPGYTIDWIADQDFGNAWLTARLSKEISVRFMPRFAWRDDGAYVLDRASTYTFSIEPIEAH